MQHWRVILKATFTIFYWQQKAWCMLCCPKRFNTRPCRVCSDLPVPLFWGSMPDGELVIEQTQSDTEMWPVYPELPQRLSDWGDLVHNQVYSLDLF